jgi:hypothetical protein
MINYVEKLRKEIDLKIEQVESSENDVLKKSLAASHILGEAFALLKVFILSYTFKDDTEEIGFFKEIKPKLFYRLVYYRKIYNIEMNRPGGGIEAQKEYLFNELDAINKYSGKRLDFNRYYRSGSTHLDSIYFLRDKIDTEQYLETFYYERDPGFSTNCDFKVTKILANDMIITYLMLEIAALSVNALKPDNYTFPKVKLTWKGSKTDLVEQLYGWDCDSAFGAVPLNQLSGYIQNVFNIELDDNLSRTFCDMKIRLTPTPFFDRLKEGLLKRMLLPKRDKRN